MARITSRNLPEFPDFPRLSAGIDEVGRGPLAGPVVAAAVILDPDNPIDDLADSKALTESRREALYDQIQQRALSVSVAEASVEEIDEINILQASMLAMQRAVMNLAVTPALSLVDGNRVPFLPMPAVPFVKGDQRIPAISAASIIAKVHRDRMMTDLGRSFPDYGFERHKGYPTSAHLAALSRFGVLPWHRRSYAPVQRVLAAHADTAAGNGPVGS